VTFSLFNISFDTILLHSFILLYFHVLCHNEIMLDLRRTYFVGFHFCVLCLDLGLGLPCHGMFMSFGNSPFLIE